MPSTRSWAMETKREPSPSTRTAWGAGTIECVLRASSIKRASASIVVASKSVRIGNETPKTLATRAKTRPASSEWPPKSKKLLEIPIRSTSSISAQMPASICSVELRGETNSPSVRMMLTGIAANAGRSSLPWGVNGK